MHQHYQNWLVLVSILVAVLASYTALTLALRIRVASRQVAPAWLVGGGLAMGIGIWSMHFVGMLALTLPIEIAYDLRDALRRHGCHRDHAADPLRSALGRDFVRNCDRRLVRGARHRVLFASATRVAPLSSRVRRRRNGPCDRRHALCRDGRGRVPGGGSERRDTREQGVAGRCRDHDHSVRAGLGPAAVADRGTRR